MKRVISAVLAPLLLAALCSCSADDATDTMEQAGDAVPQTAQETETSPLSPLRGLDFAGADFQIGYPTKFADGMYDKYLLAEEMTGEIMNDTSLERYNTIAELLHINFSFRECLEEQVLAQALPTIMAGEDAYDLLQYSSSWENPINMIQQNALYNILSLPYVDLDAEYFYADINRQFAINDKLYFAASSYNNAGQLPLYMVFNKDLMTDMQIELPYETIMNGDFTYDYFLSSIKDTATDLDGDGKMGANDRWGYANLTALTNYMVFGFQISLVERTEQGAYIPSLQSEKLVSAMQKIVSFTKENAHALHPNSINPDGVHIFARGESLYTTSGTSMLDLRSIEKFDFGIAPYPKYDADQQTYACYLFVDPFCVPLTVQDTEKVGAVTEALAIVSAEKMTPAFLDVYVENKFLRDPESVEVARLLMDNVCIDITRYYDFAKGTITPYILLSNIKDAGTVVSHLASLTGAATAQAEEFFSVFYD